MNLNFNITVFPNPAFIQKKSKTHRIRQNFKKCCTKLTILVEYVCSSFNPFVV